MFTQLCGINSAVECQLPKLKVAGSNPVSRSTETRETRRLKRELRDEKAAWLPVGPTSGPTYVAVEQGLHQFTTASVVDSPVVPPLVPPPPGAVSGTSRNTPAIAARFSSSPTVE